MNKRYIDQEHLERVEITIPLKEQYLTIPRLTISDLFDKLGLKVCDIAGYKVAVTDACRNLIILPTAIFVPMSCG